jgi:hypothetical protein
MVSDVINTEIESPAEASKLKTRAKCPSLRVAEQSEVVIESALSIPTASSVTMQGWITNSTGTLVGSTEPVLTVKRRVSW